MQKFWCSYTVMAAVNNTAQAWMELQPATMNSTWRKLWPECVPTNTSKPDAMPQLRRSIVALASYMGFGNVAKANIAHLLQAHVEPLPHGVLWNARDGDTSDSGLPWEAVKGVAPEEPKPNLTEANVGLGTEEARPDALSPEHLAEALSHFTAGLQVLTENDPNRERNLRVSRGIHCALALLWELHLEGRLQAQAAASSEGPVAAARVLAGSLCLPWVGPAEGGCMAKGTNPGQTSTAVLYDLGLGPDLT